MVNWVACAGSILQWQYMETNTGTPHDEKNSKINTAYNTMLHHCE